jgi:DNA mismatch repair protein MutS2
VLLDELGAGTDPDEGAALARAILEALDARGALVVASTHLEPLKTFASTYPRARNASVEFDTRALAPTFRLRYDVPGQSYALAIARRLGVSAELIERAETYRSADAARMSELIARLDEHARSERERSASMAAQADETTARLASARAQEAAAEARARAIVERAKADATALLADVRRTINAEWERLKRSGRSKPSLEESRQRLRDVSSRIVTTRPDAVPEPSAEPLAPGMHVQAEHLGVRGEVIAIVGDTATVQSGAITVRVPVSVLRRVDMPAPSPEAPSNGRAPDRRGAVVTPIPRDIAPELLLLGKTTDEARDLVERYLDDAFVAGRPSVRLVHGKGTGALRKAVRRILDGHPLVDSFRDGEPSEGGAGATVVQLRVG